MNFKFEEHKNKAKNVLLAGVTVAALASPQEVSSQILADSLKNTNDKSINIDTTEVKEEIPSLIDEIDTLRVRKVAELKDGIETLRYNIELNSDFEKFEKSEENFFRRRKEQAEKNFKEWQAINLDNFSEDQVALLIDYIIQPEIDAKTSPEDRKGCGEISGSFGHWESFKQKNNNERFDKDERLKIFYYENIYIWMENLSDAFQEIINSLTDKQPKEKFKEAIDKLITLIRSNNNAFKDEDSLEKIIKIDWEEREPVEKLNEEIKKVEEELRIIDSNLNIENVTNFINSSRVWLLDNISSDDYLIKLTEGEGYSLQEAKKIQSERLERIRNIPTSIDPSYLSMSGYRPVELGADRDSISFNAYDVARYPTNPLHEFEHANTRVIYGMSNKAKELYRMSLLNDEELKKIIQNHPNIFPEETVDYWKNFSELDARKKVLEEEMEKLGIKKRGEIMTEEHYLKLKKLFEEGKLDHNCEQIILITTKEGLIRAINSIAFNQQFKPDEKGNLKYSGWDYNNPNSKT